MDPEYSVIHVEMDSFFREEVVEIRGSSGFVAGDLLVDFEDEEEMVRWAAGRIVEGTKVCEK